MKILSVNAGSSSLKFQMYEMPSEEVLISGTFERISLENSFYTIKINGEKIDILFREDHDLMIIDSVENVFREISKWY